jgi:hypothetical protein
MKDLDLERVELLICAVRNALNGKKLSGDGRIFKADSTVLEKALEMYDANPLPKMQVRYGCLGCPMVDGKCPYCGNECGP